MFGASADALSLQDLADIEERFEVLWLGIFPQHVLANKLIAARMPLMGQHDWRLDIAFIWQRVSLDRLKGGKRLKAVFAHEARVLFLIFREWQCRVPDLPVMGISDALVFRVVFEIGTR